MPPVVLATNCAPATQLQTGELKLPAPVDPDPLVPPAAGDLALVQQTAAALRIFQEALNLRPEGTNGDGLEPFHTTLQRFAALRERLAGRVRNAADAELVNKVAEELLICEEFAERLLKGCRAKSQLDCRHESYAMVRQSVAGIVPGLQARAQQMAALLRPPPSPEEKEEQRRRQTREEESPEQTLLNESNDGAPAPQQEPDGLGDEKVESKPQETGDGIFYADMVAEGPGGAKERRAGRLRTHEAHIYQRLAVTHPLVVVGDDGKLCDAFVWLKQESLNPALKCLIQTAKAPRLASNRFYETVFEWDLPQGQGMAEQKLPLPPGYAVAALSFSDGEGRPLGASTATVHTSMFGGLRVTAPEGAVKVSYALQSSRASLSAQSLEALQKALPVFNTYAPPAERELYALIAKKVRNPLKRAELVYEFIKERGMVGTSDPQVARLINGSGSARDEIIAGLGAGNCLPFAYHLTLQFLKVAAPALLIGGYVPTTEGDFIVEPGHAQALAVTAQGLSVFDLTLHLAPGLAVNSGRVSKEEWEACCAAVRSGTRRQAFETGRTLRAKIVTGAVPEKGFGPAHGQVTNSPEPRLSSGLIGGAAASGYGYREPAARSLAEDDHNDPAVAALQRAIRTKGFAQKLISAIKRGAKAGSYREAWELFKQVSRGGALPAIQRDDKQYLPREFHRYIGFSAENLLTQTFKRALQEGGFPQRGKTECADWLAEEVLACDWPFAVSGPLHLPATGGWRSAVSYCFGFESKIHNLGRELLFQNLSEPLLKRTAFYFMLRACASLGHEDREKEVLFAASHRDGWRNDHHGMKTAAGGLEAAREAFAELQQRGAQLTDRERDACLALLSAMACAARFTSYHAGSSYLGGSEEERACRLAANQQEYKNAASLVAAHCAKALDHIFKGSEVETLESFFRVLMDGSDNLCVCSDQFLTQAGLVDLATDRKRAAAEVIMGKQLLARAASDLKSGFDYPRCMARLEKSGLRLSLESHKVPLQRLTEDAVKNLSTRSDRELFNYPDAAHPYSTIWSAVVSSSASILYDNVKFFLSRNALVSEQRVKDAWPEVDEEQKRHELCSLLQVGKHWADEKYLQLTGERNALRKRATDIQPLMMEFLGDSRIGRLVFDVLCANGEFEHELNAPFAAWRDEHPEEWVSLIAGMRLSHDREPEEGQEKFHPAHDSLQARALGALVRKLSRFATPWEYYHLALAIGELGIVESPDDGDGHRSWQKWRVARETALQPLNCFVEKLSAEPQHHKNQASLTALMHETLPDELLRHPCFSPYGAEKQTAALLFTPLSEELRNLGESAAGHRELGLGRLSDTLHRLLHVDPKDDKRTALWRGIMGGRVFTEFHEWGRLGKLRSMIDNLRRASRRYTNSSYATYLQSECGTVLPRQGSTGEFDDHRPYVPGDNLRDIDWRLYARSESNLQLIKRREPEKRPLVLVIDMEWLADGWEYFEHRKNKEDYKSLPQFSELFLNLFLAQSEKVYPDLLIFARGVLTEHFTPEQMRQNLSAEKAPREEYSYSGGWKRRYDELFMEHLCARALSTDSLLMAERAVSKGLEFEGVGLLTHLPAEVVRRLPRQARVVAGVHPRHREASMLQLEHLARNCHGSLHLIKKDPEPVPETVWAHWY